MDAFSKYTAFLLFLLLEFLLFSILKNTRVGLKLTFKQIDQIDQVVC